MKKIINPGFSLMEMLIAISLLTIFVAFAFPSFKNFYDHIQQKIFLKKLIQTLEYAKNEAILMGQLVVVCQSENQKSCSGSWNSGYLVYTNQKILLSVSNNKNTDFLHWRAFPYYLTDLEFLSNGLPNFQNGTFWYCEQNATNPVWAVVMNQSGRIRADYPDQNGQILDEQEKPLLCET